MTLIITITCPEGTVMSADRKITGGDETPRTKIIKLNEKIVFSYWGDIRLPEESGISQNHEDQFLYNRVKRIISTLGESDQLKVDKVAKAVSSHLNSLNLPSEFKCGLHFVSYGDGKLPIVFHVHRNTEDRTFYPEHYNKEYHDRTGKRYEWKDIIYYFPLFNGVTDIAYFAFNGGAFEDLIAIPRYSKIDINEAKNISKQIISIARYLNSTVGEGINSIVLYPDGKITRISEEKENDIPVETLKPDLRSALIDVKRYDIPFGMPGSGSSPQYINIL